VTHNERVLALLSDGEPHSHREMYGLYVMAHSRVADLRKRGHDIRCWREGDLYLYQLQDPSGGTATAPSPLTVVEYAPQAAPPLGQLSLEEAA
jgi:hypothetical protein